MRIEDIRIRPVLNRSVSECLLHPIVIAFWSYQEVMFLLYLIPSLKYLQT